MKKTLAILLAAILTFAAFTGCSGGASGAPAAPSETGAGTSADNGGAATSDSGTYKIGCTFDYLSDFMAYVVDGVTAYGAEHDNVEVTVQDANFDVAKQLQQVENFINGGYDAVVIKPVDADGCLPISNACRDAGIPLVVVNTSISADCDSYIGSDHVLSGQLQGEYVVEQLGGEGKVAILQGDLKVSATQDRTDGNNLVFDQYDGIEVVSMQEANWMRDEAMQKVENWLNSALDINAIVANNDEMALGAALVLKEAGITDILVCGIDASEDALNALKEGTMSMTVFQNGYGQGYAGVETAVKILSGESVSEYVDVPYETVLPEQADEYLAIIAG